MTNKVIAQVVKVGKQYKTGDTVITALEPSTMDLESGGTYVDNWSIGFRKNHLAFFIRLYNLSNFRRSFY